MGVVRVILYFVIGAAFAASLVTAAIADKRIPNGKAEIQLSFAPLVAKAVPAVVNIFTRKIVQPRRNVPLFDDPFFRQFFREDFGLQFDRRREHRQNSLGSGVIVDPNGLIVTNKHVIEGADEITVILADRREFNAALVAKDNRTDLAILRIASEGEKLPHLELKNSDDLEVGDLVLAIGNPFGVGQTVTSGIVSALARTQFGPSNLSSFIQTDASINPGNSGGALIAMDGRLVGVNTAIYSKSGGSLGIGFAIPSNMVRAVVTALTQTGTLVRPWLGATGQSVSQDIAASMGMERPMGVLVSKIYRDGVADNGGVRISDVILTVNGHEVDDPKNLLHRIATLAVGDTITLRLWRRDKVVAVKIKLKRAPERPLRNVTYLEGPQPLNGVTVANMSPALAEELNVDPFARGVFIMDIRRGSNAYRLRFQMGDFVRVINTEDVGTVVDLKKILHRKNDHWEITIERNGKIMNLVISH